MEDYIYSNLKENEIDEISQILLRSFHFEKFKPFRQKVSEYCNLYRVIKKNDGILGGLGIMPLGQWFGKRKIDCGGIFLVGIDPSQRGIGIGKALMINTLKELYYRGTPLSFLYPSTMGFYRKMGYERAGFRIIYELSTSDIQGFRSNLEIEEIKNLEIWSLSPVYDKIAASGNGCLQRHEIIWNRIIRDDNMEKNPYGYFLKKGDEIKGYIIMTDEHKRHACAQLNILDYQVSDRETAAHLLDFLRHHGTIVDKINFPGGINDPLVMALPEQKTKVFWKLEWMLRIVNVKKALELRGYPESLSASVSMDISDDILEENKGPITLTLSGGKAKVEPGGADCIKMDIRTLSQLFSCHLNAEELHGMGLLTGEAKEIGKASLIFSGPRPYMPDII